MSVIFNSAGEAAKRTTNIVPGNSNYTCTFYVKNNTTTVAPGKTAFVTYDSYASYANYAAVFLYVAGLTLEVNNGSGAIVSTQIPLTLGQWYRVAYVRVGTTHRFYVNGVLISSLTSNFAATTLNELWLGDDATAIETDLEIAYFREWNSALSLDTIRDEWLSTTVVSSTGLWSNIQLISNLNDDSGNGYNLTAVGSLTFDATKPAFPANAIRANATNIAALPLSTTQNVFSEGLAYAAWYKYTGVVDDVVIGVWGYGDGLTPYSVFPTGFKDALTTQFNQAFLNNRPIRFSVLVGSTYYIGFIPVEDAPATALLKIEAERFVQQIAPIGSIFVNDDANSLYFPAGIFSSLNNDNYNNLYYINGIVEGEAGDVLLNGKFLLSSVDEGLLRLYGADAVAITDVAIDLDERRSIRTCHGSQTFFVGSAGNPVIINEVDENGTILDTWSMTGTSTIAAIAANNDRTILYNSGTSAQAIRRWDLVNDVALSNFLPTLSGYQAIDILVLADDTILISYQNLNGSGTATFQVRRYDAAATLLNTYNFGVQTSFSNLPCRMAYAIDDPNSFWVYLHLLAPDDGVTVFRNVQVSSGATIREVRYVEYNQGLYMAAETLTPLSRFGNSLSCPFFITREAFNPPSVTGSITVLKLTNPNDPDYEFNFTTDLTPNTFTLRSDEEITFEGLEHGSIWSIVEDPDSDWSPTYTVSNDPDNDNENIVVEGGVDITVIVWDTRRSPGSGLYVYPLPSNPDSGMNGPPGGNPPGTKKTTDDFVEQDGNITTVKIPNPYFITGFIVD